MQNLIYNTILGVSAGYITNDYAIKMLFDEVGFGKLKIGGVVVKTRKEFEDKISSLVEEEIINPKNLKYSLENDEFHNLTKNLFSRYFSEDLPEHIKDKSFVQLDNFLESKNNLLNYINNNINDISSVIIENIGAKVHLNELISTEQLLEISKNIFNETFTIIKKEKIINNYINDLSKELENKKISEIITKEPIFILGENVSKQIHNIIIGLKETQDVKINKLLNSIVSDLGISLELRKFEINLKEQSIEDLLKESKSEKLKKEILALLKNYINSPEANANLKEMSESLFNYLEKLDKSILEFMNPDIENTFICFIENKLPEIIEKIIKWVKKNNDRIEAAIEDSIDEVINESGTIKETILRAIKNNLGNVAKEYGIVGKIIDRIEKSKNDKELSKEFSKEIIQYLKNTKINEIIKSTKIITPNNLVNLLKNNIEKSLNKLSYDIIPLNKIKLKYILPDNLTELVESYISKELVSIKDNFIYSDKCIHIFEKEIKNEINKLKDTKLNELLTEDDYINQIEKISQDLYSLLDEKKEEIIKEISKILKDIIANKPINEFVSENIKVKILKNIDEKICEKLEIFIEKLENTNLKNYIKDIKTIEKIDDKAANFFISTLINNLPILMKGNIKNLVQKNIINLDNDQLKEMMRDFMGKELKPLNIMGGVLGGLTGLGVGFLQSNPGFSTFDMLSYGVIGVLTNCIAIWGIFKPYTPKLIFFNRVGVIPHQKGNFAKNMSRFVERELLNKDVLDKTIQEKKTEIRQFILDKLKNNKKELIDVNIVDNIDSILDYSSKFIIKNKKIISTNIIKNIDSLYIDDIGIEELKNFLKTINFSNKEEGKKLLKNQVREFLMGNTNIEKFISEERLKKIIESKFSTYIEEFIDKKFNSEFILSKFNIKLKTYDSYLNKNLKELVDTDLIFKYIKEKVLDYDEITKFIYVKIDDMFNKEFDMNKNFGDIFDGKIMNFIKSNSDNIPNIIINKIQNEISVNENNLKKHCVDELHSFLYDGEGVLGGIKNLFKKAANYTLGGDEIVRKIVGRTIFKTQNIISESEYDIRNIFNEILYDLENTKISTFNLKLNPNNTKETINKIVRNDNFIDTIEKSCKNLIAYTSNKPIKFYLNTVEIKSFCDITSILKKDFTNIFDYSKYSLIENYKKVIVNPISQIMLTLSKDYILELKMKEIFSTLTEDQIENISNSLFRSLITGSSFKNNYNYFLDNVFDSINSKKIETFINLDILSKDLNVALEHNLETKKILDSIFKDNSKLLKTHLKGIIFSIDDKCLDDILVNLMDPFIDIASENINNIFDSLKINELTYQEIMNMENKKLHHMFNSFAGKYFNKLKIYGAGGALFAIPYFNILLIGYYLLSNIIFNKKIENKSDIKEHIREEG